MLSEPPAARPPSRLFCIGRNSRGQWVVQDQQRLRGGLFIDRAEALKFARFESANRAQAVIMVPGVLELDMSAKPQAAYPATAAKALARAA
jgi:hypothetical protein